MSTRNNKSSAKKESSSKKEKSSQDLTLEDLKGCIVTREKIAAFLNAPWFADWIKGSFVRYLVGKRDNGEAVYRLSNIVGKCLSIRFLMSIFLTSFEILFLIDCSYSRKSETTLSTRGYEDYY